MADRSITQLPVATALTGNEVTVVVQNGITKQTQLTEIANLGGPTGPTGATPTGNITGIDSISTPDYIQFSYKNLVEAIGEAIDKQSKEEDGNYFVDEKLNIHQENLPEFVPPIL